MNQDESWCYRQFFFAGPAILFLKLVGNGYNKDVMIFEVITVVRIAGERLDDLLRFPPS